MDHNPYVNANLPATRDGACDPALEVESRLAVLADLIDGWAPDGPSAYAYDLIATAAWLERVRPELVGSIDSDDLLTSARCRIQSEATNLAELALRIPNPDAWLNEAETLLDSYEQSIEPSARAAMARRLFDDLDDAELVVVSAGRLGIRDDELRRDLERCRDWFARHADAFLAAGVYIQAVGQALRPELADHDAELAGTASKVVDLIAALVEMEADLAFQWIEPIGDERIWPLIERFASGQPLLDPRIRIQDNRHGTEARPPSVAAYPFHAEAIFSPPVHHLAAEGGDTRFDPVGCVWRSPDARLVASLYLFQLPASNHETVTITFTDSNDRPAREIAGQPVQFGDRLTHVEDIGPNVAARFTWGELCQLHGELRLFVGPERAEWEPIIDAS